MSWYAWLMVGWAAGIWSTLGVQAMAGWAVRRSLNRRPGMLR